MEEAQLFMVKQKTTPRKKNTCVVVLVISNVILCAVLLGTVIYWHAVRQSYLQPKEQDLCVPATSLDLSSHIDLKETGLGEVVGNNGEKTLCGKASVLISLMVKKSIEEWDEGEYSGDLPVTPEGCTTDRSETPSGHAHGIAFDEMDGVKITFNYSSNHTVVFFLNYGKSAVVHWTPSGVHLTGGIEHRDGSFIVKRSGYYYISSQVTFSDTNTAVEMNGDTDGTFRHYIYKRVTSEESAEKILEAAKGICDKAADRSETTSVVGATFYLNENDEVFVMTSNAYRLVPSNGSNHFALYMI